MIKKLPHNKFMRECLKEYMNKKVQVELKEKKAKHLPSKTTWK